MRALPFLALLLVACGARESEAPRGISIDCALDLKLEASPVCTLQEAGRGIVVIRHPDGGFRRFVRKNDTLALADGAERLDASAGPDTLRLAVGDDVYYVPVAPVARADDD